MAEDLKQLELEISPTAVQNELLRFGTSSFSNKDWIGPFYPTGTKPADYLKVYATRFNTVEIDSTYYAVPSASTVDGWAKKTPDNFLFALKFPASIVHGGEEVLPNPRIVLLPDKTYETRDRFLTVAARLGNRLGPLVLPVPLFPPGYLPCLRTVHGKTGSFLGDLPDEFRYREKIRNRRWLTADLAALCRRHNASLVLTDYTGMPLGDEIEAQFDPVTTDFTYLRLIGDRKEIEAITTHWDKTVIDRTDRLKRWAGVIQRHVRRNVKTFVYVNNHYAGYAPETLRKLSEIVFEDLWDNNSPPCQGGLGPKDSYGGGSDLGSRGTAAVPDCD